MQIENCGDKNYHIALAGFRIRISFALSLVASTQVVFNLIAHNLYFLLLTCRVTAFDTVKRGGGCGI